MNNFVKWRRCQYWSYLSTNKSPVLNTHARVARGGPGTARWWRTRSPRTTCASLWRTVSWSHKNVNTVSQERRWGFTDFVGTFPLQIFFTEEGAKRQKSTSGIITEGELDRNTQVKMNFEFWWSWCMRLLFIITKFIYWHVFLHQYNLHRIL